MDLRSFFAFCKTASAIALFCGGAFSPSAQAAPLEKANIHKIINDVRVLDTAHSLSRTAVLDEVIKGTLAVRTGVASRTELLFQDDTLTRLGAESFFTFAPGTRDITLGEGTMLLQVPKGHGGAHISTAAVTAAITGTTIMIENKPDIEVKVSVLEGSLRLALNKGGEEVTLHPGEMIVTKADDKELPKPIEFDLRKAVETSDLIDSSRFSGSSDAQAAPLPSLSLIEHEVGIQESANRKAHREEMERERIASKSDVAPAPESAFDFLGLRNLAERITLVVLVISLSTVLGIAISRR